MKRKIGIVVAMLTMVVFVNLLLLTTARSYDADKLEKLIKYAIEKEEGIEDGPGGLSGLYGISKIEKSQNPPSERNLRFVVRYFLGQITAVDCIEEKIAFIAKDGENKNFQLVEQKLSMNGGGFLDRAFILEEGITLIFDSIKPIDQKEGDAWLEYFIDEMFQYINKPNLPKGFGV